jgi:hypothetical protein
MGIPRNDLRFILVVLGIMGVLLIIRIHKENTIENNKVFVAAIIKEVDWLSNGFLYTCEYQYEKVWYPAKFTGILPKSDSLVLLKISTLQPDTWMLMEGVRVSKCYTKKNIPANGWTSIPTCHETHQTIIQNL